MLLFMRFLQVFRVKYLGILNRDCLKKHREGLKNRLYQTIRRTDKGGYARRSAFAVVASEPLTAKFYENIADFRQKGDSRIYP